MPAKGPDRVKADKSRSEQIFSVRTDKIAIGDRCLINVRFAHFADLSRTSREVREVPIPGTVANDVRDVGVILHQTAPAVDAPVAAEKGGPRSRAMVGKTQLLPFYLATCLSSKI